MKKKPLPAKRAAGTKPAKRSPVPTVAYPGLVDDIGTLLETARHATARAVNSVMTATYWEIGRRIVEYDQGGLKRAG
jgi:hypothetical protein